MSHFLRNYSQVTQPTSRRRIPSSGLFEISSSKLFLKESCDSFCYMCQFVSLKKILRQKCT